ncbi:MAG: flippase-like domain-containing protein, partial [Chloroflexi bacterium]|nr:flippase-like domain-containing protein [Chloroflexota bacterium]
HDFANRTSIPLPLLIAAAIGPFAVVLGIFFTLVLSPSAGERIISFVLRFAPTKVRGKVEVILRRFIEGLESLRSPKRLAAIFVLTFPVWMAEGAMYWMVAQGFHLHVPFHGILLSESTSNLATSVPSTAGGVGPFEYATRVTLEGLNVAKENAAAYAIVLHVALLAPVTVVGLWLMWTFNMSLGELARRPASRMLESTPTAQAKP